MQTNRRLLMPLLNGSYRSCHQNPLGPSRGTKPPPWATEKLLNEGHSREEILSNWEKLIDAPVNNFGRIERFLQAIRRDYDISPKGIREMMAARKHRLFREDQLLFRPDNPGAGPEIVAAQFLVERSAAVKFQNAKHWIAGPDQLDKLPSRPHPSYIIEAIDLRDFQIINRGFERFAGCKNLKSLRMVNQKYVDDFSIDAVTAMFGLTLEYLDISGCKLITDRGLGCLHRCEKLKLLKIHDLPNVKNAQLLAILLEETLPDLEVEGVDLSMKPEQE